MIGAEADHEYLSKLGYPVIPEKAIGEVSAADFDALVVPGGGAADRIAANAAMVRLIEQAAAKGATIGAVSRAPKILGAAALRGKRATGAREIAKDLTAGGATYVDEAVVVDGTLITARAADDMPALCRALAAALGVKST